MIYVYLKIYVINFVYFVVNINVIVYIYMILKLFFIILFFFYWRGGGGGVCLIYIKIDFFNECIGLSFLIEYYCIFIRQCMVLYFNLCIDI